LGENVVRHILFKYLENNNWGEELIYGKLLSRNESVTCKKVVKCNTYLLTYLVTYLLTYSMEHSPSWEADQLAASQDILCIL